MNSIRWWLPPTTLAGPFNESGCKLRNLTRQRPTELRCRCRVLNTVWVLIACLSSSVFGQQLDLKYQTEKDLPYYGEGQQTEYQKERCLLDVYYPMQDGDAALARMSHSIETELAVGRIFRLCLEPDRFLMFCGPDFGSGRLIFRNVRSRESPGTR